MEHRSAKSIPFDFMSQFPFCIHPPPPPPPRKLGGGNYYRQWSAAECRHAPLVRNSTVPQFNPGFKIENTILAGKTVNRFRGVLHFDRYFKWPGQRSIFSPVFLRSNTPADGPRVMNKNSCKLERAYTRGLFIGRSISRRIKRPDIWHFFFFFSDYYSYDKFLPVFGSHVRDDVMKQFITRLLLVK